MTLVDVFIQQTERTAAFRERLLDDISDEQGHWQPQPDVPPIAWHVGHIAAVETGILLGMGKGELCELAARWYPLFKMSATLPDDLTLLPALSVLKPETAEWRKETLAFLKTLTPDALHKPLPHRKNVQIPEFLQTFNDCLGTLGVHAGHHNGEISLLRRLLGKPGLA